MSDASPDGGESRGRRRPPSLAELGMPGERLKTGRPPFAFRVEGPPDWTSLRTTTEHLPRDVERMCRQLPGWRELAAAEQHATRTMLLDLGALAHDRGAVLTLAAGGRDARTNQPFMASLMLSWLRTDPLRADLDLAQLVAGAGDHVEVIPARLGAGVLRCEVIAADGDLKPVVPGRYAYTAQSWVPVPNTRWMGMITGTTPVQAHAEAIEKGVRRMAGSLDVPADVVGNAPQPTDQTH